MTTLGDMNRELTTAGGIATLVDLMCDRIFTARHQGLETAQSECRRELALALDGEFASWGDLLVEVRRLREEAK